MSEYVTNGGENFTRNKLYKLRYIKILKILVAVHYSQNMFMWAKIIFNWTVMLKHTSNLIYPI